MRRSLGVLLVLLGALFLTVDGTRWDRVIANFPGPGSHGLHASEIVGLVFVLVGLAVLGSRGSSRL